MRNSEISCIFNCSFNARNSFAFLDCCSKGPTCFSSSDKISFTLTRFCLSASRFFSAAAFLFLNFTIPAASSNNSLLSSGLPLRILSICPWPIIEYPSFPIPVSKKSSCTSFKRQEVPFNKYSLSPERYTRRATCTSS